MRVNLYNAERYVDPTAYEALTKIEREARQIYRPLVYICSPYAGEPERNTRLAREYCRFAVTRNCIPIAPHLLFPQFMEDSDPEQRRLGLFFGLVLQSKCKEMWVFGQAAPGNLSAPVNITKGMAVELEKARERGLPIRYFLGAPEKSSDFLGRGEATKQASFRGFAEVSEAEFASTKEVSE